MFNVNALINDWMCWLQWFPVTLWTSVTFPDFVSQHLEVRWKLVAPIWSPPAKEFTRPRPDMQQQADGGRSTCSQFPGGGKTAAGYLFDLHTQKDESYQRRIKAYFICFATLCFITRTKRICCGTRIKKYDQKTMGTTDSQAEPESVDSTATSRSLQFKSKWIVFILMEM